MYVYICIVIHCSFLSWLYTAIAKIDEEYIAYGSVQIPEKKHKKHCFLEACKSHDPTMQSVVSTRSTYVHWWYPFDKQCFCIIIVDKCVCYCPSIMLQSCMHINVLMKYVQCICTMMTIVSVSECNSEQNYWVSVLLLFAVQLPRCSWQITLWVLYWWNTHTHTHARNPRALSSLVVHWWSIGISLAWVSGHVSQIISRFRDPLRLYCATMRTSYNGGSEQSTPV